VKEKKKVRKKKKKQNKTQILTSGYRQGGSCGGWGESCGGGGELILLMSYSFGGFILRIGTGQG